MKKRLFLLHGPNMRHLGRRPDEIYGQLTYADLVGAVEEESRRWPFELNCVQSDDETWLIRFLQDSYKRYDGGIVNLGGFSHTSVALRDAIEVSQLPVVEVHLSDPTKREAFRQQMITATACCTVFSGEGIKGYFSALDYLASVFKE